MSSYTNADFDHSPFIVFYETTRACDLACRHCRASAQRKAHPDQLTNAQSRALLDQLASFPKPPLLVFTGGDPLKREDIFDLVAYGRSLGLEVAMTPSATPLVTREAIEKLKEAGVRRLAVSLDGADDATHDAFRGFRGSYQRTMEIMADAREIGIPLQVNTTVTRRNIAQLDDIADLLAEQSVILWSVFFLIPVGRGKVEMAIEPHEYEQVFAKLWETAQTKSFGVKTTEAHHYRRFVKQLHGDPQRDPSGDGHLNIPGHPGGGDGRSATSGHAGHAPQSGGGHPHTIQRAPLGINDGKGVFFVSHIGEIYPSGFMPIEVGRFPRDNVVHVYQNAELMKALRNPDGFHGKCGVCEYRFICGGSRARAFAVLGDPLGPEPDCIFVPEGWTEKEAAC
jgi:radical SAM protein